MLYILTNLQRGDNQWTYGAIDAVKREFTRRRLECTEVTNVKDTIRRCAAHGDPIMIPTPGHGAAAADRGGVQPAGGAGDRAQRLSQYR